MKRLQWVLEDGDSFPRSLRHWRKGRKQQKEKREERTLNLNKLFVFPLKSTGFTIQSLGRPIMNLIHAYRVFNICNASYEKKKLQPNNTLVMVLRTAVCNFIHAQADACTMEMDSQAYSFPVYVIQICGGVVTLAATLLITYVRLCCTCRETM